MLGGRGMRYRQPWQQALPMTKRSNPPTAKPQGQQPPVQSLVDAPMAHLRCAPVLLEGQIEHFGGSRNVCHGQLRRGRKRGSRVSAFLDQEIRAEPAGDRARVVSRGFRLPVSRWGGHQNEARQDAGDLQAMGQPGVESKHGDRGVIPSAAWRETAITHRHRQCAARPA